MKVDYILLAVAYLHILLRYTTTPRAMQHSKPDLSEEHANFARKITHKSVMNIVRRCISNSSTGRFVCPRPEEVITTAR